MKGVVIANSTFNDRPASAFVKDGKLIDFLIGSKTTDEPIPGAIYRGVVGRNIKGLNGVFVDLGKTNKGYLKLSNGLTPGSTILVQVTTIALEDKAPTLTQKIIFKSKYVHITPGKSGINLSRKIKNEELRGRLRIMCEDVIGENPDFGLIIRSSCVEANESEIATDIKSMWALAHAVMQDNVGKSELLLDGASPEEYALREWSSNEPLIHLSGNEAFENSGIDEQIEALTQPYVKLGEDGSMYIESTRAMIAVDVNSRAGASSAFKVNLKAAEILPKELRLRGLGGQIVIDFAPMAKNNRKKLETVLLKSLKEDPVESTLVGWTQMGHFEIQRKRERVQI